MNVKIMLAITAIVAAAALATATFTVPNQVMAYKHNHHNNHNNNNAIKVDQQINQLNACTNALCANDANNTADIRR
jgi:hypothetical protein